MALQLIIGGSGAGKSYCLQQQIIRDSIAHPRERYVLLVPEQFTMQTQKDLVTRHPAHGIMNIDVQSFQRLAYHVFDEVGGSRKVLEETGKSLVIRRLAQQNREKLTLLGSKLERMGYVGEMKSVLSELTQYRVGPELLEKLQKETGDNRVLADKLHDIQVLQEAFQAYKEETYITSEEIPDGGRQCGGAGRFYRIYAGAVSAAGAADVLCPGGDRDRDPSGTGVSVYRSARGGAVCHEQADHLGAD